MTFQPATAADPNRQRPLTANAKALYVAICEYKRAHDGNSPSTHELMAACQITSTSVVNHNMRRLAEHGLIVIDGGQRSIRVMGGAWTLDA